MCNGKRNREDEPCITTQKKLCGMLTCFTCKSRSAESSEIINKLKWSDENVLKPWEVRPASHMKFKFDCECGHTFENSLDSISRGRGCPFCSKNRLCSSPDCTMCHGNSAESVERIKEHWSLKNEDTPRSISKHSGRKRWFECKCGHEFEIRIADVTNGVWCPYCKNKKLCRSDTCIICFKNSFASSCRAENWSKLNSKTARESFLGSNDKYVMNCKCGHAFTIRLCDVKKGRWCGYCHDKLCDSPDCNMCFKNSFASSYRAKHWSKMNNCSPRSMRRRSHKNIILHCSEGHIFKMSPDRVTDGKWCPKCIKNKNIDEMTRVFCTKIDKSHLTFEESVQINQRTLRWDMVIRHEGRVFHIENDGGQHFTHKAMHHLRRRSEDSFDRFRDQCVRDRSKDEYIIHKQGGLLFRISYRQLKQIPELVDEMMEMSSQGIVGVVFMDKKLYSRELGLIDRIMIS